MRILLIALTLLIVKPVLADQRDGRLDVLFAALEMSHDIQSARMIEGQIWEIWGETKDGKPAQLMEEGTFAMANRDFFGAIEKFTELTMVEPGFAEGWNKRATVYYLVGKYDESVEDIQRTLALEPRHFGALSGLGLIMMRLGRTELALKSFKSALEIHPHMPAAKAHVEMLEHKRDGEAL